MENVITLVSAVLGSSVFSGILSYIFTKRKYNSEVDSNVIENMQKALEFYKNLSDDTTQRLEKISDQNEALSKQIEELKAEVSDLKSSTCKVESCNKRQK